MLAEIISSIVTAVNGFLGGFGTGTVGFFNDIFTVTDSQGATTGVSTLGIFILALVGLSIALAIIRWVTNLVTRR
jgi:hypothetical protein